MFIIVLQAAAIGCGLVSAFFWWRSSKHVAKVYDQASPPEDANDLSIAMTFGEDKVIVYDFLPGSQLNARGAMWAAFSILAQAASVLATMVQPH